MTSTKDIQAISSILTIIHIVTTTHVVGVYWAAGSNQLPCLIRSTPTNTTSIGRLQPMKSSERSEVG
jgi:hypothetical protein